MIHEERQEIMDTENFALEESEKSLEGFLGPLLAVKANGIERDALGGEVVVRSQKIAFRLPHPGLMRFIRHRLPCPGRWRWPERTQVCERLHLPPEEYKRLCPWGMGSPRTGRRAAGFSYDGAEKFPKRCENCLVRIRLTNQICC